LSASAPSSQDLSLAAFIIKIAESNFRHTQVSAGAADANTAARAALHVQSVLRRDYDLIPI
jgi:hypothetical protein